MRAVIAALFTFAFCCSIVPLRASADCDSWKSSGHNALVDLVAYGTAYERGDSRHVLAALWQLYYLNERNASPRYSDGEELGDCVLDDVDMIAGIAAIYGLTNGWKKADRIELDADRARLISAVTTDWSAPPNDDALASFGVQGLNDAYFSSVVRRLLGLYRSNNISVLDATSTDFEARFFDYWVPGWND